jgi:AcrR family transcriptional regulator
MRVAVDHRELILTTAAKLFAKKPFHEVLMNDIADKAGIAKGTIYRHYANKDELFSALAFSYMEKMTEGLKVTVAGQQPPLERLRMMIFGIVKMIREHSDFFQVMQRNECNMGSNQRGEFFQRRNTIRACFVKVLDEAIDAGVLKSPFSSSHICDMLLGMIRGVLRFAQPQPEPAETAEMMMHLLVHGLGITKTTRTPKGRTHETK